MSKPARRDRAPKDVLRSAPPRAASSFAVPAACLFAVAWLVRLAYLVELDGTDLFRTPLGDARGYDLWAQSIAGLRPGADEVFFQAPLYPYVVGLLYAVFGRSLLAVRVLQTLAGAAACVLVADTGRRLFRSPHAGLAAGVLLAIYPLGPFYDGLIEKTSLAVFCLAALLWLLVRADQRRAARWLVLGGVAAGCLMLLRENAGVVVPVAVVWLLAGPRTRPRVRRAGDAAVFVAGCFVALAPVAWHNYMYGAGGILPTTFQMGVNLWIGNGRGADGTYRALDTGHVAYGEEREAAVRYAEAARGRRLQPAEVSAFWTERTVAEIVEAPGTWVALMGRKWLLTWSRREWMDSESYWAYAEHSWVLAGLLHVLPFWLLLALGAAGVVATWKDRARLWLLYALVLTLTGSVAAFFVFERYRALLVPLLALLGGAGLAALRPPWAAGRLAALAVAAGAAAALAFAPVGPVHRRDPRAITYQNLGGAVALEGRLPAAEEILRRALALEPDYPLTVGTLGEVLHRRGRLAEAVVLDERALLLLPPGAVRARRHVATRRARALEALSRPPSPQSRPVR